MADLEDFPIKQEDRLIAVDAFAPGPKKIVIISLEGVEELSCLPRFRLEIVTKGRALKSSEALGQKLGLTIRYRDHTRKFNGVISRMEVLRTSIRDHHLHLVELTPPHWFMTLNQRHKIFPETKSADIINQTISAAGLQCQLASVGDQREYWVQYAESDFNLIARLLEEEGLFYRFDLSKPDCTMISGNGSADYQSGETGDLNTLDHLSHWQPQYRIGPSAFKQASWDFKQVAVVDANSNGVGKFQPGGVPDRAVYEFPGRHETDGEATRLAKNRMEEHEASVLWVYGATDHCQLENGYKFAAPNHDLDLPGGGTVSNYVAIRVEHRARDVSQLPFEGAVSYQNDFVAIPSDASYRPPRVTPRPFIQGPQTAIVTDTPDEFGRCKVRFPWEQEVSRWTRVAQPWAYNTMGTQWFPRIDSEVVVDFENGDPDHPIVVGQLYNGKNKPPFDVPANKTQSGFRGANWGDAGTADVSNELRFEDKAGSEEIYIHAQKDMRRVVVNDESLKVEQGNRTIKVEMGNVTQTIDKGNYDLNITMGEQTVDAMQQIKLTVGQSSITIDQTGVTIKGMMIKIQGDISAEMTSTMTKVNGDAMLTLKGGLTMIN